VSDVEHVG